MVAGPLTYNRATFSRSYSSNLQSSLAGVLSRTLEYSSRLPVSVYGTSQNKTHYPAFLVRVEVTALRPKAGLTPQ